jgi:4-alpha-glucanotransferase
MANEKQTDAWGIDDRYIDAMGKEHLPSSEARAALIRAMGGKGEGDQPPADGGSYADVVVLREGVSPPWKPSAGGRLELEGGEARTVAAGEEVKVPLGYHQFHTDGAAKPIRVIGCPRQCHLPDDLRVWGWAVQLYATRSRESWGIGDLADLRRLGAWSRGLGAAVAMLNPLTAATPIAPIEPSPYYPSSRRFRNPLYLRVEETPGAGELGDDLARLARSGVGLNDLRRIDRDAILALKMSALERVFARFGQAPAFDAYRAELGPALDEFATFCAIAEIHGKDWRRWPEDLRRPHAAGVARFAEERRARVTFHVWLQWLLDEQVRRAAAEIGLVQDLPIGLDIAGADAWCWQEILADGVSVGAPPDEFNPPGQDWGLTPFVPYRMRSAGYQPFIETIRATARHAAGLRIDHLMGLFRLYWIPRGRGAANGAYVRTRAEELMGILALESQRAHAFVVGEDLGTVEPGVRETMADYRMLSYKLLFFEEGPPSSWPELALSTVTTHDLPTVAGLWTGADLKRATSAGAPQNEEGLLRLREKVAAVSGAPADAPVVEAIEKTYAALAAAPSRVLLAPLEDALAIEERPNIPGAPVEWPNWAVALPQPLEEIESQELPRKLAAVLSRRA